MGARGLDFCIGWEAQVHVSWKTQRFFYNLAPPAWTQLRLLGQSPLLRMTILVPFLGTLLLFNAQVVDFLILSSAAVANFVGGSNAEKVTAASYTISRLQSAYLGLTMLGLAAGAFAVVCPNEIKRHASVAEFRSVEEPLVSTLLARVLLLQVADAYDRSGRPTTSVFSGYAYRDEQTRHFRALADHLTDGPSIQMSSELILEKENKARFVCDCIVYGRHKHLRQAIEERAPEWIPDMLDLKYQALDHSKPMVRLAIFIAYALGFAILLVPTVQTFMQIAIRMVGG